MVLDSKRSDVLVMEWAESVTWVLRWYPLGF